MTLKTLRLSLLMRHEKSRHNIPVRKGLSIVCGLTMLALSLLSGCATQVRTVAVSTPCPKLPDAPSWILDPPSATNFQDGLRNFLLSNQPQPIATPTN